MVASSSEVARCLPSSCRRLTRHRHYAQFPGCHSVVMHVPSSLTISCDACLQVSDEESSQTKAFHFLFSHVGCRGLTQPEISHPKWNAFKEGSGHQQSGVRPTSFDGVCELRPWSVDQWGPVGAQAAGT